MALRNIRYASLWVEMIGTLRKADMSYMQLQSVLNSRNKEEFYLAYNQEGLRLFASYCISIFALFNIHSQLSTIPLMDECVE